MTSAADRAAAAVPTDGPEGPGPHPVAATAADRGVGVPDGIDRLWAPHRMTYLARPVGSLDGAGCPFCAVPAGDDAAGLIVARGAVAFVVLNLYPYNPGHAMVVPYRHVAGYDDLTDAEVVEVGRLTQRLLRAVRAVSGAGGFNVGLNLGAAAGAGIAEHLHQQVVPRWPGDTNFMPVVGNTKVLPQVLADTRTLLAEAFATQPHTR